MTTQTNASGITAEFDDTGNWLSLRAANGTSMVRPEVPMFDLVVDRLAFFRNRQEAFVGAVSNDGRTVTFEYQEQGLRISHRVSIDEEHPALWQSVSIKVLAGGPRMLMGVHYFVPGFVVGDPGDCRFQAIGQYIPPDTPYADIAATPLDRRHTEPIPPYPDGWLEPCPDQTCGLVAIENQKEHCVAGAWFNSNIATCFPTADGTGETVDLTYRHQLMDWLKPGFEITSEVFGILVTDGSLDDHLKTFSVVGYPETNTERPDVPEWFQEARLFQICPQPINEWTAKLEELRDIGFNLLYLMPVQDGEGYVIRDHFGIRERVGTKEDLRAFVDRAHELGMNVIFDFIPQGIGCDSPFVADHEDWLVKDELGRPFGSHTWGPRPGAPSNGHTLSMDWGNPDYRKFAVDWAIWYVKEFDIDGFRTDAMHWKEVNWSGELPHETMFGGVRLSEDLLAALQTVKPGAALLSEVWGPIFHGNHHASYENGWLLSYVNTGWLTDEPRMNARQWTRYLTLNAKARPSRMPRAVFTSNHDMQKIAMLAHDHPLGDTVSFMHMFTDGFPFVMWRELPGREAFFKDLLEQRRKLCGYSCSHDLDYDARDLFAGLWTRANAPGYLAVANLSQTPVATTVSVPGGCVDVALGPAGYALQELS